MTATPVSSTNELADAVHAARARREPVRVRGAGTWLQAGRPCTAVALLDTSALSGIVEYEPGDFTLAARAGTSLGEIERVTAAHGQWLTLVPHGTPSGTLGATVATASSGPLSSAFGTPRDHVLGCEFVSGTGDIVRAGGRVVKNVAGFDLVRLVTGAWGSLGALTEVTVRLRARPEVDRTLAIALNGSGAASADAAWRWLRDSEYAPLAAELVSGSLAQQLAIGDAHLLVRLGGNAAFVSAAESAVSSLGAATLVRTDVWQTLAAAEPADAIVLRASTRPSRVAILHARVQAFAAAEGGYVHTTLTRGIVRCVIPTPSDSESVERVQAAVRALGAEVTLVGERLPARLWVDVTRARPAAALAARVRAAFDPDGIMNPGILRTT